MSPKKHSGAKKTQPIARRRYTQIKQFIGFRYTGTKANKAKIKAYYDELEPILRTSHGVFKGKSQRTLKAAAGAVGLNTRRDWRQVPFVNNGDDHLRFVVSKSGKVTKVSRFAIEHQITFDMRRLAKEGASYVYSLVEDFEDEIDDETGEVIGPLFTVNNGPYTMDGFQDTKETLGLRVESLMQQYPKSDKHHYYKQWLHGATLYEPTNQIGPKEYLQRRHNKRQSAEWKANRRKDRKEYDKAYNENRARKPSKRKARKEALKRDMGH